MSVVCTHRHRTARLKIVYRNDRCREGFRLNTTLIPTGEPGHFWQAGGTHQIDEHLAVLIAAALSRGYGVELVS